MVPHTEARIDWQRAVAAVRHQSDPFLRAHVLSLSALHADDFEMAGLRLREATALDPFEPIHLYRRALHLARFGDFGGAVEATERLRRLLPDTPSVDYLRALIALRSGNTDEARGIAASLIAAHPEHVQAQFLRAEAQVVYSARLRGIEKYLLSLPTGSAHEGLWADLFIKIALLHPTDGPALVLKHLKKLRANCPARQAVEQSLEWLSASPEKLADLVGNEVPGSRSEALLISCLINVLDNQLDQKLDQKTDQIKDQKTSQKTHQAQDQPTDQKTNPDQKTSQKTDQKTEAQRVVRFLHALRSRYPDRPILAQTESLFLARIATELAANRQYDMALRVLERCESQQPQDPIYVQDRAAVFTLLREWDAYHDGWAALDRQHYRLIALGLIDATYLGRVAATHRLFAQQTRGHLDPKRKPEQAVGIFRIASGQGEQTRIVVNSDEIAADPDLLRQWIHHSRAELIFRHLALGENPAEVFLYPLDRDTALQRAEALVSYGESLAILVPEEGELLSEKLEQRWRTLAGRVQSCYTAPDTTQAPEASAQTEGSGDRNATNSAANPQTTRLEAQHLEVLGDLALLCYQWSPEPSHLIVAEDLIRFFQAERGFFNAALLRDMAANRGSELSFALRLLRFQIAEVTEQEPDAPISAEQWEEITNRLIAELLIEMAMSAYARTAGSSADRLDQALSLLGRARECYPTSPRVELLSARLFVLGERFEQARLALERFRHFVDPARADDRITRKWLEDANELDEILRQKRQAGEAGVAPGEQRDSHLSETGRSRRIEELEQEVDRYPTSWLLYQDIVHELARTGRFDEGVEWADRAVNLCLGRTAQMNVRALAVEARGLQVLARDNPGAARLYVLDAHEPARRTIEALMPADGAKDLHYGLHYLLGKCHLAMANPQGARLAFQKALDLCDRPLHKALLRSLANDIDTAYLAVARSAVNNYLDAHEPNKALDEALAVFGRLQEPSAWLVELARVLFTAALDLFSDRNNRQEVRFSVVMQRIESLKNPWIARLRDALLPLAGGSGDSYVETERAVLDAVLTIAHLAEEIHPASAAQAASLIDRVDTLRHELALRERLERASGLLAQQDFETLLAYWNGLEEGIRSNPRIMRIGILALLGLHRFDEADASFHELADAVTARTLSPKSAQAIGSFLSDYPSLALRQRLRYAQTCFQSANAEQALLVLANAPTEGISPQERMDLAYCHAFALAMQAYVLLRTYEAERAGERFLEALQILDAHIGAARTNDSSNYVQLYDRIELELEKFNVK